MVITSEVYGISLLGERGCSNPINCRAAGMIRQGIERIVWLWSMHDSSLDKLQADSYGK
jgi:hypothetical protein